jgi:hypothetical protein
VARAATGQSRLLAAREPSLRYHVCSLLALLLSRRYAGTIIGVPIRTPRSGAPTPLRGLTRGVDASRGLASVSVSVRANSSPEWPLSAAALSAQGLRTAVPSSSSARALLQCRLPAAGQAMASLAQRADLPCHGRGTGASPAAGPPLPRTTTSAAGRPLGTDAPRHRRASGPGSGRDHRAQGGRAATARHAVRGPAPSSPFARFFRAAMPATRLLRAPAAATEPTAAAVLFVPVPPGFASRARPRGPLALAATAAATLAASAAPFPAAACLNDVFGDCQTILLGLRFPCQERRKERAGPVHPGPPSFLRMGGRCGRTAS